MAVPRHNHAQVSNQSCKRHSVSTSSHADSCTYSSLRAELSKAADKSTPRALRPELRFILAEYAPLRNVFDISTGETLLVAAVLGCMGRSRSVRRALVSALISDAKVDPRETTLDGRSPWDVALDHVVVDVLDVLVVCAGYGVNEQSSNGKLPLHVVVAAGAVSEADHAAERVRRKALEALLVLGADVDATDAFGAKPLDIAMRNRNIHDICLLLHHNATVHAVDRRGRTPLHLIAAASHEILNLAKLRISMTASTSSSTLRGKLRATRPGASLGRALARNNSTSSQGSSSSSKCEEVYDLDACGADPAVQVDPKNSPVLSHSSLPEAYVTLEAQSTWARGDTEEKLRAIHGDFDELLENLGTLLGLGVPVNARDRDGFTALDVLLQCGTDDYPVPSVSQRYMRKPEVIDVIHRLLLAACILLRAGAVDANETAISLAASLRIRDGRKRAVESVLSARSSAMCKQNHLSRLSLDSRANAKLALPQIGRVARRTVRRKARAERENAVSAKLLNRSLSAPSMLFRDTAANVILTVATVQDYSPNG